MGVYRPEHRDVGLRMLLSRGWIDGTMQVPPKAMLADYLDHAPRYLTLTDVRAEGGKRTIPYFSVQRDAIAVLVPKVDERLRSQPAPPEGTRSHGVYCLLEEGSLRGTLRLLDHVRVSDYFANRRGFVVLRDVTAMLPDPGGTVTEQSFPTALVGARHILGVSEPEAPPGLGS